MRSRCLRNDSGQATVEAAFVIPVLFIVMLLLLQPGIVLYDRLVMGNAAAEACRLLATSTDSYGAAAASCEAFVRHRLAAVPPHDCFHVHQGSCSWEIELTGNESSDVVSVRIGNQLRPLPLFDAASKLLGLTNASGNLEIEEVVSMPTQPAWAASTEQGLSPKDWIGSWA